MTLPDKAIQEFKEIYKKKCGKELTDEEARESGERLVGLVKVLMDAAQERWRKDQKLKDFPKGYRLDESEGQYNCLVCYRSIKGSEVWWDKYGPKCDLCQKAVWKKIIPGSICNKRWEAWYEMYQMKDKFGIHPRTAEKMVREGKLKARIVPTENGKPYHYLFLKKENPKLVAYEENHKYMNEKCKCSDPECSYCLQVVCLQKDCSVHPLDKKMELRLKVIENLETERDKSLVRSENEKLDQQIREYNKNNAGEKEKHIRILAKSLGLEKERPQRIYQKLLITGIPGTGKTTVGTELEKKYDFKHIDLENQDTLSEFIKNPTEFIEKLNKSRSNIVVSWGFVPETQTDFVVQFKSSGFKLIWFDGNREAAIKMFKKRGTVSENALYIQLGNIERFNVVGRIKPFIYNTFDKRGRFKGLSEIIDDVQNLS